MGQYLLLCALTISAFCTHAASWQGIYVGGNAGGAWGILHNQLTMTNGSNPLFYQPVLADLNATGSKTFNALRFGGGAQVGYNQELPHQLLLGLELSYDYTSLIRTFDGTFLYSNSPTLHTYTLSSSAQAKQIGTLRPRLGYHLGNTLPYFTAGGAVTSLKFNQTFTDHQYGLTHTNQYNQTRWGWTVGAGLEHRPLEKISFRLEYLYANFGRININSPFLGTGSLTGLSANMANTLHNIAIQTLLFGINYHFE